MRNESRYAAALCAALFALLPACKSTHRPENTYVGSENSDQVNLLAGNFELTRSVEIVNTRSERRSERLFVQFELRNKLESDLKLEWDVDWFDASGFAVDARRTWKPLVLGGLGSQAMTITGPTPAATTWQLKLR